MKTVSIFLALVNSIFAGFLIVLDLSSHGVDQSILWWMLIKLSAASLVIAVGVFTWLGITGIVQPGLVLLGNVFLVALGPAVTVWTLHVALVTGDVEYYMAVYGGALLMQGLTSLLGFAGESRNVALT
ncbi:MAG: hypothetical protein U0X87_15045 [Anaerolineales bacterium]